MSDKKISITHCNTFDTWEQLIKDKLDFADARMVMPAGMAEDLFIGDMNIEQFRNGGLKVYVNSSAQKVTLLHKDGKNNLKNKFILLSSCRSLMVKNAEHRAIISGGDSIIIPAWERYTEESFSGRNSLSFIFNISCIADTVSVFYKMIWRNISSFKFGNEINKIISNFYNYNTSRFCEKNTAALLSLLSLEGEAETTKPVMPVKRATDERYPLIINYIKNNIRDPELCLSSVAEYFGITTRMIQYILAEADKTFFQIISAERCSVLASKIKHNPYTNVNISVYESGFRSIATANRQFSSAYGVTPGQYQRKILRQSSYS